MPVVFDKKHGIHPLWSEYYFLSNKTKSEKKYYPKDKKLPYDLSISGTPTKKILQVVSPEDGSIMYTSPTFAEAKFLEKYNTDENFRGWFNYSVQVSVQQRIICGMFRSNLTVTPHETDEDTPMDENQNAFDNVQMPQAGTPSGFVEQVNPETGEVMYVPIETNSDDMPVEPEYYDNGEQPTITSING